MPPVPSELNYDELYPSGWQTPANYIRFSSTVEDCIDCPYDMTEEDDVFLKAYNAKFPAGQHLSEDDFERIMDVFEETASFSTPFAAVDKSIAPFSDMQAPLNRLSDLLPHAKDHAKALYEYWSTRREACHGPLHPVVKFETQQEADELDPYICFRRREIRQTRKTRARDVQSADKLKRLRRELEMGRSLIIESYDRELQKRDMLQVEKQIFETRMSLKDLKVRLGIKTHDTDLWNQKVSNRHHFALGGLDLLTVLLQEEPTVKKRAQDAASHRAAANAMRHPQRNQSAQSAEVDLIKVSDLKRQREEELIKDILTKIANHTKWNRNHVDLTNRSLPPAQGPSCKSFRAAQAQYLMTPPASSASQQSMEEPVPMDLDDPVGPVEAARPALFQFQGAPFDENEPRLTAYRQRIGRSQVRWIDRRPVKKPQVHRQEKWDRGWHSEQWTRERDQYKYDQSDSEGDETIPVDPYDTRSIRFRATIPLGIGGEVRRQARPAGYINGGQQESAAAQQAARLSEAATRQGPPAPT